MKKTKINVSNRYGKHNVNRSVFGEKRITKSYFKNK